MKCEELRSDAAALSTLEVLSFHFSATRAKHHNCGFETLNKWKPVDSPPKPNQPVSAQFQVKHTNRSDVWKAEGKPQTYLENKSAVSSDTLGAGGICSFSQLRKKASTSTHTRAASQKCIYLVRLPRLPWEIESCGKPPSWTESFMPPCCWESPQAERAPVCALLLSPLASHPLLQPGCVSRRSSFVTPCTDASSLGHGSSVCGAGRGGRNCPGSRET